MNLRTKNRPGHFWSLLLLGMLALGLTGVNEAQAAPQWVSSSSIAGSSGGNVTVTLPAHQANDILLLQVMVRDTNDTITWPSGWTQIATVDRGTTARYWWAWARAASSAEPNPVVSKSTGNGDTYAAVTVYRGAATSGSPWDVVGTPNTATTAAHVLNGITTATADTFIIASLCGEDNTAATGTTFTATDPATLSQVLYSESGEGSDGACTAGAFTKTTAGATGDVTATWTASVVASGGIVLALKSSGTPVGYSLTQCAGDRFGSDLGCTANDVLITSLAAENGPAFCKAGDFISLNFAVIVNSGSPNRHDVGIFFSNDGKDPQLTQAGGGPSSCSVFVLPTTDPPWRNIDPGPYYGSYDTCGDVNGTMNPGQLEGVGPGSAVLHVTSVTVKCQSKTGSGGKLWVPFVLSWDQQASPSGALCTSAANPVPGTVSKCNAPTVAQATVTGIVVLPKIEKSDGITTIDDNQSTTYSVVITNNTGADLGDATAGTYAIFKDPAVANLTVTGVSCTAGGGATCPASPTVADMQGAGITLPVMPAGSSLTFAVTATVNAGTPDGTLITNTATVTYLNQETSATDTNTVGSTTLNHYELALAANSVACEASTVTVTACAGAASTSPCTNVYSGPSVNNLDATLSTTAGTLADSTPTFTNGVTSTTLSHTAATNGTQVTVSLTGVPTTATNATLCCRGGSCTTGSSCTTTFMRDALFISDTDGGGVANIPHQTAGVKSGTFYVRAVKTLAGGGCDNALRGSTLIDFGYECNNPVTCYASNMMRIDTGPVTTIPYNDNGTVNKTYTPITMNFNSGGYASFAILYDDVGLVTVHTRYDNGALTGSSNAFVVKPYQFLLSNISCTGSACAGNTSKNNTGAADETGAAFVKAGSPFTVTATAVAANLSTTPSYGREAPAETVKLTPTLVAPLASVGGVNPAIENATAFGTFTLGVGTGTTFAWSEVGIITLTPSVGDGNYLAAGDVTGTTSGNVGRFIPHHFKVTDTPGCGGGATFTYSGQSFTTTSTAQALGNTTTQNYRGASPVFARNTSFTDADTSYSADCVNNAMLAANYSAGVGTLSGIVCTFQAKESPPGITLRAAEDAGGDSVTSADGSAGNGDDSMDLRSGRVRLFNANGSELLHLAVPMRVEYYVDTTVTSPSTSPSTVGWIVNPADTCSTATLKAPTNCKRQLDACQVDPSLRETCVQDTGNPGVSGQGCTVTGSWELYTSLPTGGIYSLWLKAPGAGNYGSVDLAANLSSAMPWLQYDWDGDGNHTNDPVGTATFGTYRGNPRHIHIREIY